MTVHATGRATEEANTAGGYKQIIVEGAAAHIVIQSSHGLGGQRDGATGCQNDNRKSIWKSE